MRYKYDIAISVAEEDIHCAEMLAKSFKNKGIRYYLYTEHPEDAGKSLEDILVNVYGKESRIIVVLWSCEYRIKYWAMREREMAITMNKHKVVIRLDDTPLDDDDPKYVYLKWDAGGTKLADTFCRIVHPHRTRNRVLRIISFSTIGISVVLFLLPSNGNRERVIIKIHPPPGVYKGNTTERRYAISKKEITVAQFSAFCSDNSSWYKLPPQPAHRNSNKCPVVNITWNEAMAYCKWVGGRLPTQAEWEYAALGGESYGYSGSNNASEVAVYGNGHTKPSQVGTLKRNGYGLYDMSGNVAEWCAFDSSNKFYSEGMPVRGGAFSSSIYELKISAQRIERPDSAKTDIGFRVVWDIKN